MLAVSCSKVRRTPRPEFAPQMYRSVPYDPDQGNAVFADGKTAQTPPEGTVDQSKDFYFPYAADDSSFHAAGRAFTKNPVPLNNNTLAEGKSLYLAMCSHCHGKTGKADAPIVLNGTYPTPPPAFNDPNMPRPRTNGPVTEYTPGMIFHTITYGYNVMGPHASLVTPQERWKIVLYVQQLQKL